MSKQHNSIALPTKSACRLTVSPKHGDRPLMYPGLGIAAVLAYVSLSGGSAQAKPFEDYLKPTPIVSPLSSASWGVAGVLPRDLSNGIESAKGAAIPPDYYYWDGEIIRAKDFSFEYL